MYKIALKCSLLFKIRLKKFLNKKEHISLGATNRNNRNRGWSEVCLREYWDADAKDRIMKRLSWLTSWSLLSPLPRDWLIDSQVIFVFKTFRSVRLEHQNTIFERNKKLTSPSFNLMFIVHNILLYRFWRPWFKIRQTTEPHSVWRGFVILFCVVLTTYIYFNACSCICISLFSLLIKTGNLWVCNKSLKF